MDYTLEDRNTYLFLYVYFFLYVLERASALLWPPTLLRR